MADKVPVVSIINCTKHPEFKEIYEKIDTILKKDGLWKIDNKYYSAKINLIYHSLELDFIISSQTEAILFLFDMEEPSSFEFIKARLNIVEEINPPAKLLICNRFISTDVCAIELIKQWSIQNDFEIIELDKCQYYDEEDDFHDIVGFDRIIEVLNCNSWSNIHLNDLAKKSSFAYNILNSKESDNVVSESSDDSESCDKTEMLDDKSLDFDNQINKLELNALQNMDISNSRNCPSSENSRENLEINNELEDKNNIDQVDDLLWSDKEDKWKLSDTENFEDLFQNLHLIKEKAQRLSFEDRKKYAEDMVKKFWLSMGEDEKEFEELSD